MEQGVLIDLWTIFVIWVPAVSRLHREAELSTHTTFTNELSTWKNWAPFIHLSLLNNSIFSQLLHQSLCPVCGYLLDVVTSHKNAKFIKVICWRIAHIPHTKALINVELTVDKENKTMMTQVLHPSKENDLNTKGSGQTWKTWWNPGIFLQKNSLYGYGKIKHEGEGGVLSNELLPFYGEIAPRNNQHFILPSFVIASKVLLWEHKFLRKHYRISIYFKIQSQCNLFYLCNFSSFQGVCMKVMFSSTS